MKRRFFGITLIAVLAIWGLYSANRTRVRGAEDLPKNRFSKKDIARLVEKPLSEGRFPEALPSNEKFQWLEAQYSLHASSQAAMERLLDRYGPDYGAFVALDATTGRLLTLVSSTRNESDLGNLTLKALFPAASIFKIVTATAALDRERLTPDTEIPFKGGNHTLYRKNVYDDSEKRARKMTVRDAFAKSVNVVFAKLGLFWLTPTELADYANRFFFNQAIASDIPLQKSRIDVPVFDKWALAELASGFTRDTLMSPLQGAIMAAAVVNDGIMMEPFVVDTLRDADGTILYQGESRLLSRPMTEATAHEMRDLMRETVRRGTSRKWFRGFKGRDWEVGGKTGSLTSNKPRGKADWFVGYATDGTERIAIAALTVNERVWRVKASYLARAFLDNYLKDRKP